MELEKLIELLLIPTAVTTGLIQFLKGMPVADKMRAWIPYASIPLGILITWLFAEIAKFGDVSDRSLVAMGFLVGLASVGMFEGLKKIPGVNTVVK